jgi:flagellar protein FliO/FliZ
MMVNGGQRTAEGDRSACVTSSARQQLCRPRSATREFVARDSAGLITVRRPPSAVRLKAACARGAAIALAIACGSIAHAAEQAKPFAAPQAAEPVGAAGAGSLAQVTLSLVLVLAAVFAAAWAMRKLRGFGRSGAGAIDIVAEIALGAKERAVLVQVGKQQLLLGVTANQVNTLHVLTEPVGKETGGLSAPGAHLPVAPSPTPPASVDFKAILKTSLGL